MSVCRNRWGRRYAGVLLAAACHAWWSPVASGQGAYDLFYIGTSVPIADETGTNVLFGNSDAPGCLVQVIQVTTPQNIIEPPFNPDGTANSSVQLLNSNAVTAIGVLASPDLDRPGAFAYQGAKPASGTKMFVRVFNAADMFDATHYADSDIYTMVSDQDIDAVVPATTNAIDFGDSDGDGLADHLEDHQGSNKFSADSDGDGMTDGEERRARTDMLDSNSYLSVDKISVVGSDIVIEWNSQPGVRYEIEYTEDIAGGESKFNGISKVIVAQSTLTQVTLNNAASSTNSRQFRVILAEPR